MTLENKIFNTLTNSTSISSYVSKRVYPVTIPQSITTFPCITYFRVSNNRLYSLTEYVQTENVRIQFDIFAESYESARSIASNLHDVMIASSYFKCIMLDEQEVFEGEQNSYLYRVIQDFSVWNKTTT